MPAKKTTKARSSSSPTARSPRGASAAAPKSAAPKPATRRSSAAVAGAARRRRARAADTASAAAPASRATRSSRAGAPAATATRGAANSASSATASGRRGSANWVKAARPGRKVSNEDVRTVLDRGVSKADKLLESAMGWIVKLAIRAKALYDMLDAWWHGKFELPMGTVQAAVVALLYFMSPLDLIPDVLPFFGLVDDAAVLAFVLAHVRGDLEDFARATGKSLSDLGL